MKKSIAQLTNVAPKTRRCYLVPINGGEIRETRIQPKYAAQMGRSLGCLPMRHLPVALRDRAILPA